MKKTLMILVATVLLFALTSRAANTWYVNDDNYNADYADAAAYIAAGYDGKSMANAFGTIQVAVAKASSGDTIYVAPGVYSNGTVVAATGWGTSRVGWANKKLYIYSTGNASNTHIVGVKAATDSGVGTDAVRCLAIYDYTGNYAGTIIKGFTFRDGATLATASNTFSLRGGAVCANRENYFIDCEFTGCAAVYGGAVYNGTFVRCRFSQNVSTGSGSSIAVGDSATLKAKLYACVLHHNAYGTANDNSGGTLLSKVIAVNCTVLDNAFKACTGSADEIFYNTIFFNSGTYAAASTFSNCIKESDERFPVMSTIIPDIRLLPNSVARTAGDGAHLSVITLPDGIDYSDYGGSTPASSGTIAAGATQTVGTPAAGGITVKGGAICVNGTGLCRKDAYSYVFPDVYPTQYLFTAIAPEGKRLSHFHFYGHSAATYDYRFPDRNDRLWVMPPSDPGVVITNYETVIRDVTYVKPDADASQANGAADHPYRTLQAAYDAKPGTVIVAKAGTYAEGGTNDTTYGRSRLQTYRVTRVTSEEGPESTIILGESDTGENADGVGCGPNAVRCIAHVSNMAQIQGFTLTGGRTARTSTRTGQGAAAWSANAYLYVDDCIISNNYANANGVAFTTRLTRCRVSDNNKDRDCIVYGGAACASVFAVDGAGHPTTGIFDGGSRVYHCTVVGVESEGVKPYSTSDNSARRYASVFLGGDTAGGNGTSFGNVLWDFMTIDDTAATVADPLLADPSNGDLHPFVASPVFGAGVAPTTSNYGDVYWYYATSDFEGNPIAFNDGKPVAGAFMKPTSRRIVAVTAENGGLLPIASRVVLGDAETYTLTIGDATRPVAGAAVNGVASIASDAAWSLTVSGADAAGGMTVSAIYTNVWYVSPNGSDLASGFFPDAAKTLQGALSNVNLHAYDRVVALPGTYRTGKMIQSGDYAVYSRAVVPANVTLESRDGRNATVIEGAQALVKDDAPSTYDVNGLGAGAVRCVLLQEGAAVKGFTLTNGWTRARKDNTTVSHSDADTCGGGVWCAGTECRVEDCFMTGNGAYRGAGAFNGFCLNCEFADNYAYYGGGASSNCRNHGCLSHGNTAATWNVNSGIFAVRDAVNCTCFDSLSQAISAVGFIGVANSCATGYFNPNNMSAAKVSHCAFNKDRLNSVPEGFFAEAEACCVTNDAAMAFDGYRPLIGKNLCIDAGTVDVPCTLKATDVLGGQRVYNGCLDIGATEADWRTRYGRDIYARATVLSADPAVVEQADGTVRVPEGASLDASLRSRHGGDNDLTLKFRVTVGGAAILTLNGTEQALSAGDHEIRVRFDIAEYPFSIAATSGFVDILHASGNGGFLLLYR